MDTTSERMPLREMLATDYGWTPRQRQVLDLITRGKSNQKIADELSVSLDGAKWHMREILSKLNVDTREEAAEYWRRYNGVAPRFARLFRSVTAGGIVRWAVGGGAVLAVAGSAAILIAGAGSDGGAPSADGVGAAANSPAFVNPPSGQDADAIIVGGTVVEAASATSLVVSTRDLGSFEVEITTASEVWAGEITVGYVPPVGSTFDGSGRWSGGAGNSTFVVESAWFNLRRVRARLLEPATQDGTNIGLVFADADGKSWLAVVEPRLLTYASIGGIPVASGAEPGAAKAGWGIDAIGFERPDGSLLVTWMELYPD
ncbi:MAG: helix-turn-helix transcriptional regulator [Dehalococcoidia bacterium]